MAFVVSVTRSMPELANYGLFYRMDKMASLLDVQGIFSQRGVQKGLISFWWDT